MKQSSIEWLMEIDKSRAITIEEWQQAIAIHKEEIVSTWHNGYDNQSPMIDEDNCGEQYYSKTFNIKQK